ncbi:hypothetical protein [Chroogloeocystis siderophila]|uniref:hypothetical protein n=1 Tax=Chroogloeocystis siderophila TaxID=329163 RepID=UPI000A5CCD6B
MTAFENSSRALLKREEKHGRFPVYNGRPRFTQTFISFNLNKGRRQNGTVVDPIKSRWFNTLEFRQAIAYAIDRQTMLKKIPFVALERFKIHRIHRFFCKVLIISHPNKA